MQYHFFHLWNQYSWSLIEVIALSFITPTNKQKQLLVYDIKGRNNNCEIINYDLRSHFDFIKITRVKERDQQFSE